jgi:predicted Ser/Thr protein kinase
MNEPNVLAPGDRLAEFRIVRRLGEGGMGVVYLAEDEHLGRPVALKVIAPQLAHDPEFQRRFEAEARNAAAIDDPHVVPIYSAGTVENKLFIAMRFVDGTDLRSVLAESGALEPGAAVAIVAEIAAALDGAHAAGLVHRDVKPANILLTGPPGGGSAYLTDFGLTKGLQGGSTQLTGTGQWIGTLDYVAPEQMTTGRIDARTDVYALGCVLYEMLAGSIPFAGSDVQKMWNHVNEAVPPLGNEGAPHPLDAVIARATAKDPDDRFPSAGDLARGAAAALDRTEVTAPEHSVATGVAATGLVEGDASPRTRTMKAAPPPPPSAPQPTTRMAQPPPPRPRQGGDSATRTAAVIGGCFVLAAGLIAAAVVLAGGGKSERARTVVNRSVETVGEANSSDSGAGEEAADAEAGTSAAAASSTAYSQTFYTVEIPSGWAQEESDEPIYNYLESTWHDPADSATILIDAQTPGGSGSPVADAESVRAETENSSGYREHTLEPTVLNGIPAARWVFDVSGDRRVDYFVEICGIGIAMLGSTSPIAFGSLAPTFHQVASSIEVLCGE